MTGIFVSCSHLVTIDLWKSMISGFAPQKATQVHGVDGRSQGSSKGVGLFPPLSGELLLDAICNL